MLLCTISNPHLEALSSRVLATSTIHKRHWGLSFTEHKKTMGRITKGNLYLNHMKVINPWENKNWILLVILMLYYWLAWLNGSVLYALYTLWGTGLISFTASNLQSTTPTPLITL